MIGGTIRPVTFMKGSVLVLAIVALCIGTSAVAQPSDSRSALMKKIACTEIGWKYMDRWVAEESRATGNFDGVLLEVRYAYNPELDTCVVGFERLFARGTPAFSHFHIVDVLSGKSLAFANSRVPSAAATIRKRVEAHLRVEREHDSLRGRNSTE